MASCPVLFLKENSSTLRFPDPDFSETSSAETPNFRVVVRGSVTVRVLYSVVISLKLLLA